MPTVTPKVSWTVTNTTEETVGGVALVKKELLGKVDNSSYPAIDASTRPGTRRARTGRRS
jgi:hypothetical protein